MANHTMPLSNQLRIQIEHLEALVEALPDVTFKCSCYFEMSAKLLNDALLKCSAPS